MTRTKTKRAKRLLHAGSGPKRAIKLPAYFSGWREVRMDIDPACKPDICCSMTDMAQVKSASFAALYSQSLEHLYPHEVPLALKEFRRVLDDTGIAVITLPDLQSVAELVALGRLEQAALDMLYGQRPALARGRRHMAHRTGFTHDTLLAALVAAGFSGATVARQLNYDLWAIAYVAPLSVEERSRIWVAVLPDF